MLYFIFLSFFVLWVVAQNTKVEEMQRLPEGSEPKKMLDEGRTKSYDECPHEPKCENYRDCQLTTQIEKAIELHNERKS